MYYVRPYSPTELLSIIGGSIFVLILLALLVYLLASMYFYYKNNQERSAELQGKFSTTDKRYTLYLEDGKEYSNISIMDSLGGNTSYPYDGGMDILCFVQANGKQVLIRRSLVKYMEEM